MCIPTAILQNLLFVFKGKNGDAFYIAIGEIIKIFL